MYSVWENPLPQENPVLGPKTAQIVWVSHRPKKIPQETSGSFLGLWVSAPLPILTPSGFSLLSEAPPARCQWQERLHEAGILKPCALPRHSNPPN